MVESQPGIQPTIQNPKGVTPIENPVKKGGQNVELPKPDILEGNVIDPKPFDEAWGTSMDFDW